MGQQRDTDIAALIPGLDVAKAKRYSRTRLAVLLVSTLWSVAQLAWFSRGRSAVLRDGIAQRVPDRRLVTPAFVAVVSALGWLSSLPLDFIGGYLVERRFGLTKQRPAAWGADQAKGLGVGLVLGVPLVTGAYEVIRRRPRDWWLVLSGVAVPLSVVAGHVAPTLLMPIFNKFEPLGEGDLSRRVAGLAERAGVRVQGAYQMDMSRQTEKPNAFFAGLGNTKRVVLSDTLVERFPPAEVDGVVAHELGHQANGDIWRMIGFSGAVGFLSAWLIQRLGTLLVRRTGDRHGIREVGDIASLPLLGLAATLVGFATAPLAAAFSRRIERRTDRFALDLTGDGESYASAMARLASQSLADPDPPKSVVFFLYSHPPIAERVATARAFARSRGHGTGDATATAGAEE